MLMKRCPSCNRTYADETMTFCLADGSLLSAPYDPQVKQHISDPRGTDSPTVMMSPAQIQASLLPRQEAKESTPMQSNIASPMSLNSRRLENFQVPPIIEKTNRLPWLIGGIILLLVAGIALAIGYNSNSNNKESSDSNSDTENAASASADNSNASNRNTTPPPEDSDNTPVDQDKIFSEREVDHKAKITAKPAPQFTEEARKNQFSGIIMLRVVLSSSGQVTNIRPVAALPYGLTEQAIAAARQIKFVPAIKDGRDVSQHAQIEYNFSPN